MNWWDPSCIILALKSKVSLSIQHSIGLYTAMNPVLHGNESQSNVHTMSGISPEGRYNFSYLSWVLTC